MAEVREDLEVLRTKVKEVEKLSRELLENHKIKLNFTIGTDKKTINTEANTFIEMSVSGQIEEII